MNITARRPLLFPTSEAYDAALEIVRSLRRDGHVTYFVGGCVRDALLGQPVKDYDVATSAPPRRVEELFRHTKAVGEAFGVMLVVHRGIPFEVATFRSESGYANRRHPSQVEFSSPEEDVKRRDFTINGLFFDPESGEVIDYVGGLTDLDARRLRTIGNPDERFGEDALRLMRAVRFATSYGLTLEESTRESLCRNSSHIRHISAERIGEEWERGLMRADPHRFLGLMLESGLAAETLPELAEASRYSVVGRAVVECTARRLEFIARGGSSLDADQRVIARWAGLFFELGRPQAAPRRLDQGLWLGESMMMAAAELWREAARRLAQGNRVRDRVTWTLERACEWQNFDQLARWRQRELLGEPDAAIDRCLLEAYSAVHHTSPLPLQAAVELEQQLLAAGQPPLPPPLITGRDLLRAGWPAGPAMGARLAQVRRAQLDGRLNTPEEALTFAGLPTGRAS